MRIKKTRNYNILNVIFIGILLLINVFYLREINLNASYTFKNKLFQKEIKTLQNRNKQLVQQVSEANSISNIYAASKNFRLVETNDIFYLEAPLEKVARK